jgi:hypothetical protein
MKCSAASFILLVCLAGCHAPKPSFNLLAPYGTARVPPPSTNSPGGRPSYHNAPQTVPAATAPTLPAAQHQQAAPPSQPTYVASDHSWMSVQEKAAAKPADSATASAPAGDVRLSSFTESPLSGDSRNTGSSTLQWGVPPVPAVTGTPAPGQFVPAADASALPAPPGTPNTVVATAQSSDSSAAVASDAAGKSTLQWRSPH